MFPPCFQVLGKATLCDRAESPYRKNPGLTIFLSVNLRFLLQLLLEEKTSVLVTFTFQCNLTTNYILPCKSPHSDIVKDKPLNFSGLSHF